MALFGTRNNALERRRGALTRPAVANTSLSIPEYANPQQHILAAIHANTDMQRAGRGSLAPQMRPSRINAGGGMNDYRQQSLNFARERMAMQNQARYEAAALKEQTAQNAFRDKTMETQIQRDFQANTAASNAASANERANALQQGTMARAFMTLGNDPETSMKAAMTGDLSILGGKQKAFDAGLGATKMKEYYAGKLGLTDIYQTLWDTKRGRKVTDEKTGKDVPDSSKYTPEAKAEFQRYEMIQRTNPGKSEEELLKIYHGGQEAVGTDNPMKAIREYTTLVEGPEGKGGELNKGWWQHYDPANIQKIKDLETKHGNILPPEMIPPDVRKKMGLSDIPEPGEVDTEDRPALTPALTPQPSPVAALAAQPALRPALTSPAPAAGQQRAALTPPATDAVLAGGPLTPKTGTLPPPIGQYGPPQTQDQALSQVQAMRPPIWNPKSTVPASPPQPDLPTLAYKAPETVDAALTQVDSKIRASHQGIPLSERPTDRWGRALRREHGEPTLTSPNQPLTDMNGVVIPSSLALTAGPVITNAPADRQLSRQPFTDIPDIRGVYSDEQTMPAFAPAMPSDDDIIAHARASGHTDEQIPYIMQLYKQHFQKRTAGGQS